MTQKTTAASPAHQTYGTRKILAIVGAYILLCVFLGIGAVVLFTRHKDSKNASVSMSGQDSRSQAAGTKEQQQTQLHGIVTATINDSTWELTAYDSKGLVRGTRSFSQGTYRTADLFSTLGGLDGPVARQLFNTNFTQLAVYQSRADGGSDVGVLDTNGNFTNLTPQASTYGNVITQTEPVFNLATGRLWFNTPDMLGSVDPTKGPSSSHDEPYKPFASNSWGGSSQTAFYFTPAGKPVGTEPDLTWSYNTTIYSAGDKYKAEYYAGEYDTWEALYKGGGIRINNGALIPFVGDDDNSRCWPERFINSDTFLCRSADSKQLYSASVSSKKFTPLLPASERTINDVVGDPTGKQIAFIATSGSTHSLYIMPVSGGEPKEVAQIAKRTAILSWER